MKVYLDENKLERYLGDLFPEAPIVRNRSVPGSEIRNRPDYRIEANKLIVEFDGDLHYSDPQSILTDVMKDKTYTNLGYTVIRIPYFVQWSEKVVFNLFSKKITFAQNYSHGFIDSKVVLPATYCELGVKRFENDLVRFSFIKDEIISSLKTKAKELNDIRLVLPPSLCHLLGD